MSRRMIVLTNELEAAAVAERREQSANVDRWLRNSRRGQGEPAEPYEDQAFLRLVGLMANADTITPEE